VLKVERVDQKTNFFDAGGNSILAVRLVSEVKKATSATIPLNSLFDSPTFGANLKTVQSLQGKKTEVPFRAMIALKKTGKKTPVFFVPSSGGSPLYLRAFADAVSDDRPFYAFQARGLEKGEVPFQTVEEMAECFVQALRAENPNGPYIIAGHSTGGPVAYHVASLLGDKVKLLIIVDIPMPLARGGPPPGHDWNDAQWISAIIHVLGFGSSRAKSVPKGQVAALSKEGQLQLLENLLEGQSTSEVRTSTARAEAVLRVMKAADLSYGNYRAKGKVSKVLLVRAQEAFGDDPLNVFDGVNPEHWGWGPHAEELQVRVASGNHLSCISEPKFVAAMAKMCLEFM